MRGYGASKCAGIMRNEGMKRQSAAMRRWSATMVRRNGDEMATTSDGRSTRLQLYLRTTVIFILKKTAFQSVTLIFCNKHELNIHLDLSAVIPIKPDSCPLCLNVASASPSNSRFINIKKMFDAQ